MNREIGSSRLIFFKYLALIIIICSGLLLEGQPYLPSSLLVQLNDLKRENRFDDALNLLDLQLDTLGSGTDPKPGIEARFMKADLYRMKGLYSQSSDLLDSISSDYSSFLSGQDPLSAQLFTIKGTLLLTRGDLMGGRRAIEKAITIYTNTYGREDTLLGPCYNKLGNYYYFNKKYDSALAYYSRALELTGKKRNKLEDIASYTQNIGIIHLELSEYEKAETFFLESLRLKESYYSPNSFSLGRLYLNLARFYQGITALDKSLHYILKAERIFYKEEAPAPIELGGIYWNKGLIFYLLGDYEPAITYLFNAMFIFNSICPDNIKLISSLNADIGNVYKNIGHLDKAIQYYNLSIAINKTELNIKTSRNLANLYLKAGDFKNANKYFQKLLIESLRIPLEENPENALTFLYYGIFLIEIDVDSALRYLNKSHDIFLQNKGFHNRDVAFSLYSIGDYYQKRDLHNQALSYYQKSLISFSSSFSDTNIYENPNLNSLNPDFLIVYALSRKSTTLKELFIKNNEINLLKASIQTNILCLDLIDRILMTYRTENSQMVLLNEISMLYEQTIDNCLLMHDLTDEKEWLAKAYSVSERGKSIVLLNELKDANAKKIGMIPEELSRIEKQIKSNLNLYRNNIWEEENQAVPNINKLSLFRSNQLIYEKKYDSLKDHLEQNYPEYFKLKYDNSVVTVKELQKLLETDEVLIEYTLSKDWVYIFLISEEHFKVTKMPVDSNFIQDIFALKDNLDFKHVMDYNFQDYMDYQRIAFKLYKRLIQPVEDYLDGKRIIFIPDEELNYLSFESLIENIVPSDTIDFRHLPFLIKKHPISYAASATILSLIKKGSVPSLKNGVLALAPSFDMLKRSIFANNKALAQQLKTNQDLPGATWEVENILRVMKGKKLVGEEATETEFKKLASKYDILHFATHTRIDDENPLSSMLSFYPYSGSSGDDGVLHTYEIYNMDLKGELAVLSACSTGDGKLQKGEGVISLARAFTYAGMPSVMMTLWDVEDISTGNIIPAFYHLLENGLDKDIALQAAKLNYLEKTKPEIETHPAFWSGFVLYGNNRGFRQKSDEIYIISLIILGGLIIFISFVLIRKYIHFRQNNYRKIDTGIPIEFQPEDRL